MVKPFQLYLVLFIACLASAGAQAVPTTQQGQSPAPTPEPQGAAPANDLQGLIHLDIVVTNPAGKPVVGLEAKDFAVFDGGQSEKILSFAAYQGALRPNPPVSVIVILDMLRVPPSLGSFEREQLEKFLRRNEGHLAQPLFILALTENGLWQVGVPSADGNALADAVAHPRWTSRIEASGIVGAVHGPPPSFAARPFMEVPAVAALQALGAIATIERQKPGRKLLLWIGPGWGIGSGANSNEDIAEKKRRQALFDRIVWLSTLLRVAHISLYSFSVGEDSAMNPVDVPPVLIEMQHSFKGTPSPQEATLFDQNRKTLAVESGGRVLPSANDLVSQIDDCLRDENAFYTLSFDPAPAAHADEYRDIKVEIHGGNLTIRTVPGYYDEPYFSAASDAALRRVTVAELTQLLEAARSESDGDLARQLESLELTERLSAAKLAEWTAQFQGKKTTEVLQALADRAIFLDPPPSEIAADPAPDTGAQQRLLASVAGYLNETIPKLPDFFATRTTVEFQDTPAYSGGERQVSMLPLHAIGRSRSTVLYRNGGELVDAKAARHGKDAQLITYGTFGPVLHMVKEALTLPGSFTWNHWERSASGPVAVFRYTVPEAKSLYRAMACCLPEGDGTSGFSITPGYDGEIAIDPSSGAILRIVMHAHLDGFAPADRADLAVIYGPVVIGGQTYTLPLESVSLFQQRTVITWAEWGESFKTWGPRAITLNEFGFSDYHKFRADVRMLSGFAGGASQDPNGSSAPPSSKPQQPH